MSAPGRPPPPPPRLLHTFSYPKSSVTCVLFAPNALHALIATSERHVHLVNPATAAHVRTYKPSHGYDITDVCVSSTSSTLYTASSDRHVIITAVEGGAALRKFKAHEQRVNCLALDASDALLLTGGDDAAMRVWDARARGRAVQTMTDAKDGVMDVAFLPDQPHILCSASVDGALRLYDARKGQLTAQRVGHALTGLSPLVQGGAVLLSSLASRLFLFSTDLSAAVAASSSTLLQSFSAAALVNRHYSVRATAIRGARAVVSGTEASNGLLCWDVDSGELIQTWGDAGASTDKHGVSTSVDWSEQHALLLSGSTDGDVRVWHIAA